MNCPIQRVKLMEFSLFDIFEWRSLELFQSEILLSNRCDFQATHEVQKKMEDSSNGKNVLQHNQTKSFPPNVCISIQQTQIFKILKHKLQYEIFC